MTSLGLTSLVEVRVISLSLD